MSTTSFSFVEWKEQFVSQEKGSRVVHYLLKDCSGEFVLAVVGTERSLRHMVYVVYEDFLNVYGIENTVQANLKWKSRREVVDWLTSMLCKQQLQDLSKGDPTQFERASNAPFNLWSHEQLHCEDRVVDYAKGLKQPGSDIIWLGAAWACGKQLKHYPAFSRNGTRIAIQSFVFVMAKEGSQYVAYLEDMYEDKKHQKKVKVRWFHRCQEVKRMISVRNAHPNEVFITPHTQVISAECVDGPAVVLNREHFQKCMSAFQCDLPAKVQFCIRQLRNSKIKPFDLSKMRGYFDQPILSCLEADSFLTNSSMCCGLTEKDMNALGMDENAMVGVKRSRYFIERQSSLTGYSGPGNHCKKIFCQMLCQSAKCNPSRGKVPSSKDVEWNDCYGQYFKVDEKIELLSQDSGLRGCWFRCTILEVSRKQIKVRYDDVDDLDGCGNLEEWVSAFRLASPDQLQMRCPQRLTIRPCPPATNPAEVPYEIGIPVDAWWSDGWWEGVIAETNEGAADHVQVYIPGENLFVNVVKAHLRLSRDWAEGQWIDIKKNPEILLSRSNITPESKVSVASSLIKDDKPDEFSTANFEDSPEVKAEGIENKEHDMIVSPAEDDTLENGDQILIDNNRENGDCAIGSDNDNDVEGNDNNDYDGDDGNNDNCSEQRLFVQDFDDKESKKEAVASIASAE